VRARSALCDGDAAVLRREPGSVEEVAKARGASMAQVSLAWILAKDGESRPQMLWKEGC
jgi:aryl-alcohol dehydrogenase-like predicted oxidoreductase